MYFQPAWRTLQELPSHFRPGELSYLSLTGKPEGALRDALAYSLAAEISSDSVQAGREMARFPGNERKRNRRAAADIVILRKGSPGAILEMKVHQAIDYVRHRRSSTNQLGQVEKDLRKWGGIGEAGVEIMQIVVARQAKVRIPNPVRPIIKKSYLRGFDRAVEDGNPDVWTRRADKSLRLLFKYHKMHRVRHFTYDDEWAEIGVRLDFWLAARTVS